ncbi:hypothetical protein FB451DRAFT_1553761 [Mycena latifolia]|nr:hypothetical protein FB451DRAFT_1553761 [Mycena latifolia]
MHPCQCPLDIQEILDNCIEFLCDSPLDLRACALVSHAWLCAAQPRLFRKISIGSAKPLWKLRKHWDRFRTILDSSPHLIGYIRHLDLHPLHLSAETLTAVCTFPFTRLRELSIFEFTASPAAQIALQQLFSLSTLRRARIICVFGHPSAIQQIFERCAPGLKHLELLCSQAPGSVSHSSLHPSSTPIRPQSFRITSVPSSMLTARPLPLRNWLTHNFLPFDFSDLKVLSIPTNTDILHWPNLAPVLRRIKVLDFIADNTEPPIDLSLLPNLALLRVCIPGGTWAMAIDTLATMTTPNRIRTIVLRGYFDIVSPAKLDTILSELPIHSAVVEFEIPKEQYDALAPHFHQLNLKNRLRRADIDPCWFENTGSPIVPLQPTKKHLKQPIAIFCSPANIVIFLVAPQHPCSD